MGDSVDDVRAAREGEMRCVVYRCGADALHDRVHFAAEDVLPVGSLTAAVAAAREVS